MSFDSRRSRNRFDKDSNMSAARRLHNGKSKGRIVPTRLFGGTMAIRHHTTGPRLLYPGPAQCMLVWTFLATSNGVVVIAIRPHRTESVSIDIAFMRCECVCVFFFIGFAIIKRNAAGGPL